MIDLSNIKPRQNKVVECIDYTKQQIDPSIWNRFDKIICIHYLPYVERLDNIKKELKRVGILDLPQFEWYYTVDNDLYKYILKNACCKIDREVGEHNIKYTIDSFSLLKKLYMFGYNRVLILEDDIVFYRDMKLIENIINSTPDDFDVVNYDPFVFDQEHIGTFKPVNKYITLYGDDAHVFNASCIGLSKQAIRLIVNHQQELLLPFDHYTWRNTSGLKTYCVSNGMNVCIQNSDSYLLKQCNAEFEKKYPTINKMDYFINKTKVAIVAIARLENPYINEWIEYHRNLGFDHFYIYDNSCGNEEHIDKVLTHENSNATTIIPAYDKYAYQMEAYNDAYNKYGELYEYMLFIDIDEFFTFCKHNTIQEYIDFINSKTPMFDVCRINWEIYDDNNVIQRDISVPVHKFFTQISKTYDAGLHNNSAKSLVRTNIEGIVFKSVHYPVSINKKLIYCNSNGDTIFDKQGVGVKPRYVNVAKIRHYMTKTISEFMNQKLCRDDAAGYISRNIENRFFNICKKTNEKIQFFEEHKKLNKIQSIGNRVKTIQDVITYYYWKHNSDSCNAGDDYNKYLIEKLYKVRCMNVAHGYPDIVFCGSTLGFPQTKYAKYIVGCGIQEVKLDEQHIPNRNIKSYLCVRGNITKLKLSKQFGINIPTDILLCDPGLLISRLYASRKIKKIYKIGIIPHHSEEKNIIEKYGNSYHIISMRTDDIEQLIDDIQSCEMILSSSLHGIIFAHSYGIPAYHIEFNDFFNNGNFKFQDYYSSFRGVEYRKFKCNNWIIPFEDIILYDSNNRLNANPKMSDIINKQDRFINILPYRHLLNDDLIKLRRINDV